MSNLSNWKKVKRSGAFRRKIKNCYQNIVRDNKDMVDGKNYLMKSKESINQESITERNVDCVLNNSNALVKKV